MKIVLELAANSFYLDPVQTEPRLMGVRVKSRCNNSMSPNQIILEIPEGIIVEKVREVNPAEVEELLKDLSGKDEAINVLKETIETQESTIAAQETIIEAAKAQIAELSAPAEEEQPPTVDNEAVVVDKGEQGDQG